MAQAIITQPQSDIIEQVIIKGDLSQLLPAERVNYYRAVCESIGLNPLTKPFDYISLKGKLTLYAKKDATDQLRKINGVSIGKPDITFKDDLIIVSVAAHNAQGREDSDIGVVRKGDMNGDVANALMKAVTKAKRRVTLSLCGLGWLDETEIETIPDAKHVNITDDQGPEWTEQVANAAETSVPTQPTTLPTTENGKPKNATLRYQPFVTWCNEWVQNNALAAKYAKEHEPGEPATANMWHILKRVGLLGYAEVTEANAAEVETKLSNYVSRADK